MEGVNFPFPVKVFVVTKRPGFAECTADSLYPESINGPLIKKDFFMDICFSPSPLPTVKARAPVELIFVGACNSAPSQVGRHKS